jgi:hypothetical protein
MIVEGERRVVIRGGCEGAVADQPQPARRTTGEQVPSAQWVVAAVRAAASRHAVNGTQTTAAARQMRSGATQRLAAGNSDPPAVCARESALWRVLARPGAPFAAP